MTQHPVTPPRKLLLDWGNLPLSTFEIFVIAAQWGANQELDACCEWLGKRRGWEDVSVPLRAARRPKPPSLKELALEALMTADGPDHPTPMLHLRPDAAAIIRRALESIPDHTSEGD